MFWLNFHKMFYLIRDKNTRLKKQNPKIRYIANMYNNSLKSMKLGKKNNKNKNMTKIIINFSAKMNKNFSANFENAL